MKSSALHILENYAQNVVFLILSASEKYFISQIQKPTSSLGFKYPTNRDHPLHTSSKWLEGKRIDDGAEELWRINDGLFDFSPFIHLHPGGADWLELTKGTDITEAFEIHHLSAVPEKYLSEYFVRKAEVPRISPFTFKEDGFYKTLKRRVKKALIDVPENPATRSKLLTDSLLAGFLLTALLATKAQSFALGSVSALLLTMTCIASHNFFHQKDNFRMYYFDLTMMSYREWRISHALSHHIYTNTIYDIEMSSVEPFLQYLPSKKNFFTRYVSWIYSPIVYSSIFIGSYLRSIAEAILNGKGLRRENYIPWILLLFLFVASGQPLATAVLFFFWIELVSSFFFGVIGLSAAHHHPDLFHDGDAARSKEELDWGVYQLDTVMDRSEITGSHFLILISFGDHALHHLFPTIDHGKLEYLYPVFKETCSEFGVLFKTTCQLDLIAGQFRQLAKIEPNKNPPRFTK